MRSCRRAFAVGVGLLEQHFDELVDYAFTAKVETDLDAIAAGEQKKDEWLHEFYFGEDPASDDALPGLKRLAEENLDNIDAAAINTFPIGHDADGNLVVVKPGRFGPYVKRGDDTAGVAERPRTRRADDRSRPVAARRPKADEPIGEIDGLPVFAKSGRYGPYVQLGTPDNSTRARQAEDGEPVPVDVLEHLTLSDAQSLLSSHARSAPTPPMVSRSSPATAAMGRTCRRARSSAPRQRGAAVDGDARRGAGVARRTEGVQAEGERRGARPAA